MNIYKLLSSLVSLLLIVSLSAPSTLLALEGTGGGPGGPSGTGGPSGSDSMGGYGDSERGEGATDAEGGGDPDSDGDGTSDSAESEASESNAAEVSAAAEAAGLSSSEVGISSVNTQNDASVPNNAVSVNGVQMSKEAALGAISALGEANKQGKMGHVNASATLSGYANGSLKGGQVKGNHGYTGTAREVADLETQAITRENAVSLARSLSVSPSTASVPANDVSAAIERAFTAAASIDVSSVGGVMTPGLGVGAFSPSVTRDYQEGFADDRQESIDSYREANTPAPTDDRQESINSYRDAHTAATFDPKTNTWRGLDGKVAGVDDFYYGSIETLSTIENEVRETPNLAVSITDLGKITVTDINLGVQKSIQVQEFTRINIQKSQQANIEGWFSNLKPETTNSLLGSQPGTNPAPVGPPNSFTPTDLGPYNTVTVNRVESIATQISFTPVTLDCSSGCPRGIRNNNPLNIEKQISNPWKGLSQTQTDKRFASFQSPQYGIRAAVVTISNYTKKGYRTLSEIIGRWAPPTENNTTAYVSSVSKQSGIAPDEEVDLNDTSQVTSLMEAMISVENGRQPYARSVVEEGVRMAQQDRGYTTTYGTNVPTGLTTRDSLFDSTPDGYELSGGYDPVDSPSSPNIDQENTSSNDTDTASPVNNPPTSNPSTNSPNSAAPEDNEINREIGRGLGTVVGGAIGGPLGGLVGAVLGERLGGIADRLPGLGFSGGTGVPSTPSDVRQGCPPYPLPCQATSSASVIAAAGPVIEWVKGWFSTNESTVIEDTPLEPNSYVPVLITVNHQTREVEINRPDILATLEEPERYYTAEQYAMMRKLFDETAILFGDSGEVIYSNGLYSPPLKDGIVDSDAPEYIYSVEYIDEDGSLITLEDNKAATPDNFATDLIRSFFGNAAPFTLPEVSAVTYRLIDPKPDVPRDEYYDYVVTLKDGSTRATTVPQFTSTSYMAERFKGIGYQGMVLPLIGMAKETTELPPSSLLSRMWDLVSDATERFIDVPDFGRTATLPTVQNNLTAQDIERLFIYPKTDVTCPADLPEYSQGFMYTAIIADPLNPDYVTMISDGRCGVGTPADMAAEAARHLAVAYGIEGADLEAVFNKTAVIETPTPFNQILTNVYIGQPSDTPTSTVPPTTPPPTTIATSSPNSKPNLTNTISLEVKAVGSDGSVVKDWSVVDKLTIGSGVQLYFRWDGSDYGQCLPFLQDGGNYALTRQDRAMLRGNTESERYNLPERSAVYRVECGGQRNDEFGVDERRVEVGVE